MSVVLRVCIAFRIVLIVRNIGNKYNIKKITIIQPLHVLQPRYITSQYLETVPVYVAV